MTRTARGAVGIAALCLAATAPPADTCDPSRRWAGAMNPAALAGELRLGELRADALVPIGAFRFRDDGDAGFVAEGHAARLVRRGAGFVLNAGGASWRFGAPGALGSAAIEPHSPPRRMALLEEARLSGGEVRRWSWERRETRLGCTPSGRFGLAGPDCRTRVDVRVRAVASSRGVALVPRYAAEVPGDGFAAVRAIALVDARGCGPQATPACLERAPVLDVTDARP